jgi:hypothetical protein
MFIKGLIICYGSEIQTVSVRNHPPYTTRRHLLAVTGDSQIWVILEMNRVGGWAIANGVHRGWTDKARAIGMVTDAGGQSVVNRAGLGAEAHIFLVDELIAPKGV